MVRRTHNSTRLLRSAWTHARQVPWRMLNQALHRLECATVPQAESTLRIPPIFILGAPRSGTTLLYQLMVRCLDVAYFSNLHAICYGMPTLVESMRLTRRPSTGDYSSRHGVTRGWYGPSESGPFWYRFFPRNLGELKKVNKTDVERLRNVFSAFMNVRQRPLLVKNLYCGLRLPAISRALPEALFIVVRRNELQVGHSLLEARWKRYGTYDRWFSLRPQNVDELSSLPPHEQVIQQVRTVVRTIESARTKVGASKFLEIDYERLCNAPRQSLADVIDFAVQHNCRLEWVAEPPPSFEMSDEIRINQGLYDRMVEYACATKPAAA